MRNNSATVAHICPGYSSLKMTFFSVHERESVCASFVHCFQFFALVESSSPLLFLPRQMYRRELIETQVIKQAAMHGTRCLKIDPVNHETRYVDNRSSVEWFGFEMKKRKMEMTRFPFFFFSEKRDSTIARIFLSLVCIKSLFVLMI